VGPVLSRNRNWLGPIWSSPSLWGKVSSNVEIPLVSTPCLSSISATSQHPGSKPQIPQKLNKIHEGFFVIHLQPHGYRMEKPLGEDVRDWFLLLWMNPAVAGSARPSMGPYGAHHASAKH